MRRRVSDELRANLEQAIVSGLLPAGSRLDEQSLAAQFQVSRTPAREALLQLASSGHVRLIPRQGAVVLGLTLQQATEMMEVLHALESEAAALASRRMDGAERATLRDIHQRAQTIVKTADLDAYMAANTEFHEAIYRGSRNDFLSDQIRGLRLKLNFQRMSSLRRPGRISASWAEHDAVARAIGIGDEAAARSSMALHCQIGGTAFADMIAAMTHDSKQSSAN